MPTIELSADGSQIIIESWYADNALIQMVPGSGWSDKQKKWHVPTSWPACLTLRELFPMNLTIGPRLIEWANERRYFEDYRAWWQQALLPPPDGTTLLPPDSLTLYPFQVVGSEWLAQSDAALLADEMGSGKTVQAIIGGAIAETHSVVLPILIICPVAGMRWWKREITKWHPEWYTEIIQGGVARRRKLLEIGADVYIISWDALSSHTGLAPYSGIAPRRCYACGGERDPQTRESLVSDTSCQVHPRELNAIKFGLVIADEAHRMKDPYTVQTRAAWRMMHQTPRKWAMTGTPLESDIGDLWSILHGLDPLAFPGKTKFLDLFATVSFGLWGGTEILGLKPERRDLFYRILNLYMRRLPKEVTLPFLPPKMPPVFRYPVMGAKQKQAYKQMTDDMVAQLEELLVAGNPLAKMTHQISLASASGSMVTNPCRYCKDSPGWQWYGPMNDPGNPTWNPCQHCNGTGAYTSLELTEPSCKIDDLVDFIHDRGPKPLVVFTVRRQLAELTSKRLEKLKITHGMYTGAQNDMQRQTTLDNFQAGRLQIFLGTIAAGSELITLTASDTIFFMQQHPSLIKMKQATDRVHRIGSEQHDAINIVHSVTEGTIEDRLLQLQEDKGQRFEEVVRDRETLRWLIQG